MQEIFWDPALKWKGDVDLVHGESEWLGNIWIIFSSPTAAFVALLDGVIVSKGGKADIPFLIWRKWKAEVALL